MVTADSPQQSAVQLLARSVRLIPQAHCSLVLQVNVWMIGKPQPLLSLHAHQGRVECVTLDKAEEVVVAGSHKGTLKLWDLEEARPVGTLSGHRTSCCAVDFHPFG